MKVTSTVIVSTMLTSNSESHSSFKVIYNSKVIFTPISTISPCNQEHYETNPIFCNIAKSNNIEKWQEAGIPPIFCAKHSKDNYFHIITSFGCTRFNSVKKVAEDMRSELNIPVFEIPSEWIFDIIYPQGHQQPKFILQSGLFKENGWTNYPYEPYKADWKNEDSFNGFS